MRDLFESAINKIVEALSNFYPKSNRARRTALLVSALLFFGGAIYSLWATPDLAIDIDYRPLAIVALVGVPIMVFLSSIRFRITAAIVGQNISVANALSVMVISTAANMLPLPGGLLVRASALKSEVTTYKEGMWVSLLSGLLWTGVILIYASIALSTLKAGILSFMFLAAGVLTYLASLAFFTKKDAKPVQLLQLTVTELLLVLVDAGRIWLCLLAIGINAEFVHGSILTSSAVAGSAVGIFPAGLGVREGFAALIGAYILLSPTACFIASALNRIIGLAITTLFALILLLGKNTQEQ